MLIIDETYEFGVTWEVIERIGPMTDCDSSFGMIHFLIGHSMKPDKMITNYSLEFVFKALQYAFKSRQYPGGQNGDGELGGGEVDLKKMSIGEVPNIMSIETDELGVGYSPGGFNLVLWLGYNGDKERLFYSTDYEKTYQEIVLPRNTVETVVNALPRNLRVVEPLGSIKIPRTQIVSPNKDIEPFHAFETCRVYETIYEK